MVSEREKVEISEDEAALYDRQIRLWGLDAQKRLRASRMLIVGMKGLGVEVCKNVVLAGIKSVTLLDHLAVTEEDACSQFLASRNSKGMNRAKASQERAQELNPNVEVKVDEEDVSKKDTDFFKQFDIVCITTCKWEQLVKINDICHELNIKFYAGDIFGFYGYMFADLNTHHYIEEKPKMAPPAKISTDRSSGEPQAKKSKVDDTATVMVKKSSVFCRLSGALSFDWSAETSKKLLKTTTNTYFIIQVLMKFRETYGRDPSNEDDQVQLLILRDKIMESLMVDKKVVNDEFARHCLFELSPVCAVVGGVLGQEIIKALSGHDLPHNNFFLYNGIDGSGMVNSIGEPEL